VTISRSISIEPHLTNKKCWARHVEQDGLVGLVPQKRGPKEAHKLTGKVIDFLQQILQDDPSLHSTELASRVAKRFGVIVHPRTIERGLTRRQKKRQKPG
jgi:transposase